MRRGENKKRPIKKPGQKPRKQAAPRAATPAKGTQQTGVDEADLERVIDQLKDGEPQAFRRADTLLRKLTDVGADPPPDPPGYRGRPLLLFLELLHLWALKQGWPMIALNALERLETIEPKSDTLSCAFTQSDFAVLYRRLDQREDAQAAFERAVALLNAAKAEPTYRARVYLEYAASLIVDDEYEAAVPLMLEAVRYAKLAGIEGGLGAAHFNAAIALAGVGRREESDAHLAEAKQRVKLDEEALDTLRAARKREPLKKG